MANDVRGGLVPNSSHWIPEERPDFLIKLKISLVVILLILVNECYVLQNAFLESSSSTAPMSTCEICNISKENVGAGGMLISPALAYELCRRSWVRDICHYLPRSDIIYRRASGKERRTLKFLHQNEMRLNRDGIRAF